MARSGGGLAVGDLIYFGAIGGLGFFSYKLALDGALGKAAQLGAIDVQGVFNGWSQVTVAAAKAAAEQAWNLQHPQSQQTQTQTQTQQRQQTQQAAAVTRYSTYNPVDLGQLQDSAHAFAWDQDSGTVYLINPPNTGIGQALNKDQAVGLAATWHQQHG